ncbi:hypothetical protein [Saccharopolyspora sp. NPDC050642]|uniref:hypothetical protein n=1 Tax=Saccharopolyspora sp. NPDC050642 TaxID=3157099 RepID=UPI00340079B8
MASVYALSERWTRRVLIPTAQAYLRMVNVVSLFSRGIPPVPWLGWVYSGVALVAGAIAGEWLDERIAAETGRRLIAVVALIGGAAAVVRGVLALA